MTPAEYAKVKAVFAQATEVPVDQRVDFVRGQCGDDESIVREVISLLAHHQDETILKTAALTPAAAERDTQEAAPDQSRYPRIVVDPPQHVDSYLVLSDVWDENRQILRRRLIIIAGVLASLIAISSLRLFTYEYVAWGYGVRVFALATCVLCAAVLYRKPDLTLSQIRSAEMLVMATVGLFIIVIDVRLILDVAAENDEATLISVNNWHYFAWALIIFIYGVFMPNTWQRASLILLPVAAIPRLVVTLISWQEPNVAVLLAEDKFGQPVPTPFVAAIVSIFAAHSIHAARLSAFHSKQLAQYRLNRLIGEGGMGQVFEAEHLLLKRACAIKVIRPDHCADDRALQRFQREVRATAKLTHPHTIEIYDYGQTKDGVFFFAMELLPGMSLQELVRRYGPLPPARVVHFLTEVCQSLSEAHQRGLIHRDIKPANIYASERGGIADFTKLLDFGVVREMRVDSALTGAVNLVAGTPGFMSPEQIRAPAKVDARADIYAVGAVAYYLLTGRPPFIGDSPMEIMLAQVNQTPQSPSTHHAEVPADLEAVVMRCLANDPEKRIGGALELETELGRCQCAGTWTEADARQWWNHLR